MGSEPTDGHRFLLIALGALWLMAFVYAFVAYTQAPHEGAGFPDGLNKPTAYLGWQGIAGVFAVAIFGVGLSWDKGSGARRLSQLPLALALFQAVAMLGILYWTDTLF